VSAGRPFAGRSVIVTGAGQGLGRAYALLFGALGAGVVVNDIGCDELGRGSDSTVAGRVVEEIERAGGSASASTDDVRTAEGGAAAVAGAIEAFGRVDVVVSNAALNTHSPVLETTVDELQMHLELDPVGAFTVAHAAWPHMLEQRYGRIVLSSSSAQFGAPTVSAYGAAKGATHALARSLASAGAEHGIFVNTVAPFGFSRMVTNNPNLTPAGVAARKELFPAELAAPFVGALAHESCPVNGELFAVGGGRVTHVFLGETEGYYNASLSFEDACGHWDEILDRESFATIGLGRHVADFQRKIPGWAERLEALG
jgi:NAD(P)-dependent dehydrogenase (short-subunit alcohol dehydrogenase family)